MAMDESLALCQIVKMSDDLHDVNVNVNVNVDFDKLFL